MNTERAGDEGEHNNTPSGRPCAAKVSLLAAKTRCQDHCADILGCRRFKQIGATAGAIANVIAYQIGDDCRVARIIFRNTSFHFAY